MSNMFNKDNIDNFPQLKFLKSFLIGHPGFIAGGCFKDIFSSQEPHDIDMFFRNSEDFYKAVSYFENNKDDYSAGYENKNVRSFVYLKTNTRIECVCKIFGSPEEILNQFDFTITKFAYEIEVEPSGTDDEGETIWEHNDIVVYHKKFFEHLCLKRLVVDNQMPYPVSTYNRTYKYARYGFYPCRETKMKILAEVQGMEAVDDDLLGQAMYEGHEYEIKYCPECGRKLIENEKRRY